MRELLYILIVYVVTDTLVYQQIFRGVRDRLVNLWEPLSDLLYCFRCLSTWVGFGTAIIFVLYDVSLFFSGVFPDWLVIIVNGLLASLFCETLRKIGIKIIN